MINNKKVVIFDFDGTIADTFDIILNLFLKHAKFLGIKNIDDTTIEKFRNFPLLELIEELDISKMKIPFVAWKIKQEIGAEIENVKPFKEVITTAKKLKDEGYVIGIVSSNSRRNIHKFLEDNNINLFEFVHTERNLFGKSVVLEKIIKKENFDKNNVIYVGDEARDIAACRKIGVKIISVTWGYNTKSLLKKQNERLLADTPQELYKLIKQLL